MLLTLLAPPRPDRPTGGNIYNRHLITELHKSHTVEQCVWAPGDDPSLPVSPPSGSVLVVDSLLARYDEALLLLRRAHSGPVVLLAHYLHCIDPQVEAPAAAQTERAVLPLFDGAVTTSRYAQHALIEEGFSADRIGVVPPGLPSAYRSSPPSPSGGAPRLITVANWQPGKGLRSLVDQLGTLADLDWQWTLVGDDTIAPSFADALAAHLRTAPIADRVTTAGPIAPGAMPSYYDRADLFVLPSRFETCSMATREAMARGLPVVGYAVGGMPENIGDTSAGRLVPPTHPGALVDALQRLLTAPETRTAMGRAARKRSETFPTWTTTAARFASFVQSL